MNDRQYQQVLANRLRRGLGRARNLSVQMAAILRTSAEQSRRMEALAEEWQQIAKPGWLEGTVLMSMEDGVAVFSVTSASLRFELSRQASRLARQVSRRVPGLRAMRFVPGVTGGGD